MTRDEKTEVLADFGLTVLRIMEANKDWGADTFELISSVAMARYLATIGDDGCFAITDDFRKISF